MNWSRLAFALGSSIGVLVFMLLMVAGTVAHVGTATVDCGGPLTERTFDKPPPDQPANPVQRVCDETRLERAKVAAVLGGGIAIVGLIASMVLPTDHDDW